MRNRSQSYHDAPKATPFVDQHYAHFGNYFQDHVKSQPSTGDSMEANSNTRFQVPKGMSQSRSESHLNYDAMPTRIRSPIHHEARETRNHYERREARNRHVNFSDDLGHSPVSPSTRGRLPSRAPSPIKLDDIKEDQPTDVPLSPIKRSRSPVKQLFGEHGWLGRSTSMKELPSDEYRKTGLKHWGGKLKQRVGEIVSHPPSEFSTKPTDRTLGNQTEDMSKKLHSSSPPSYHPNDTALSTSPSRLPPATKFPVSLSPPEQAKLFAEVELMICSTANQYLQTQHQYGRLAPTSVSKVAQTWTAKNRPQVLEFMYDQQTQHDLVLYNLKTFRFYGPQAENSIALNAMMLAWKQLGRDLSVRTFCTPDSAVRKQLHDAYKVLEMLGAPLVTFLAFQSLQFETVKLIQERQLARDRHQLIRYGVERRWEPSKTEIVDEEMNPFK